jgi:hypothetical protein
MINEAELTTTKNRTKRRRVSDEEIHDMAACLLASACDMPQQEAASLLEAARKRWAVGYIRPTFVGKHPWHTWETMAQAALEYRGLID